MKKKNDIHQEITAQVIAQLENMTGKSKPNLPWHRPQSGSPRNGITESGYRGGNFIWLLVSAHMQGFESGAWASYKQWESKGIQVCKGQKATPIIIPIPIKDRDDPEKISHMHFARRAVFNIEQTDFVDDSPAETERVNQVQQIAEIEAIVKATGADIRISGTRAYYKPSADQITMPSQDLFTGSETMTPTQGFYAVLLHELTHWSGAETRLNRIGVTDKTRDKKLYAMEELIAEMGSAFLCSRVGLTPELRPDHAEYIANWITLLKEDPRALYRAASAAEKASKYIYPEQTATGNQDQPEQPEQSASAA